MKRKSKNSAARKSAMELGLSSKFMLESRSVSNEKLFNSLSSNEHLVQFVDENVNSSVTSNGISLIFGGATQTLKKYTFYKAEPSCKYSIQEVEASAL